MVLQTFTSILYNIVVITSFVNGYIYFAAHLDDLENVAKKLTPSRLPVQRAKPEQTGKARIQGSHHDESKDELRVDYYEDIGAVMKDNHDATETPEDESNVEKEHRRKVRRGSEPNIDQLAKKIKDRVLKELAEEFMRLKKKRQEIAQKGRLTIDSKSRHIKKEREVDFYSEPPPMASRLTIDSKSRHVKKERDVDFYSEPPPMASMMKREKHVKPIEVERIRPASKKLLIKPSLSTRPKLNIGKQVTEQMPTNINIDDVEEFEEIEGVELTPQKNDSYEYYEVPPKDEMVFETVEETKTPPTNMVRYKIQSNPDQSEPTTPLYKPQQKINAMQRPIEQDSILASVSVMDPMETNLKEKGNDDTYIMYEVEDGGEEEEPIQTQRTTPTTTHRTSYKPTQKPIISTKPHYRMTSPDYYASLPTIAERYDFNEPIPIKDRYRSI